MPNDTPDWNAQVFAELVSSSGLLIGDTGSPVLAADTAAETIGTTSQFNNNAAGVMASFKAAAAALIAKVSVGPFTQGTNAAVTPNGFGAVTGAGNLLVCWVTAINAEPTTGTAGWVKVVSVQGPGTQWAAIWASPNSAGADVNPVFTAVGGVFPMFAQLAQFSGAATATPTDQTGSGNSNPPTLGVAMSAVDVAFGDLVLLCSMWALASPATATFSQVFNNGAAAVHAGDSGASALTRHSSFSYAIVPPVRAALPLGVEFWDYDSTQQSAPAVAAQATITLAATPGKAWRLAHLVATLLSTTAVAQNQQVAVKDGATIIWASQIATQAVIGSVDRIALSGLAIKGTAGNAMQILFGAGSAGAQETLSVGAYLR